MLLGILAGLSAGALWGFTFVAPLFVAPWTVFDLTVLRFAVFGTVAIGTLAPGGFPALRTLSLRDATLFLVLSLTGFTGYYLMAALAIVLIGPAIPTLVIGALPLTITLVGNRGRNAAPFRSLVIPLALIVVGLLAVNVEALAAAPTPADRWRFVLGAALAVLAHLAWLAYGLINARALASRPQAEAGTWTALTGLATLVTTLPLAVLGATLGVSGFTDHGIFGAGTGHLWLWAVVTGFLSTTVATLAWNAASQRLPVALAGQLIVSETIFALLYGFLALGQWPSTAELLGGALLVAGVVTGVRVFAHARGG